MKIDMEPTLFGVGTLIICGNEFAVVTEAETSPKSAKVEGQETFPMETVEPFDTGDFATIGRACSEEVNLRLDQTGGIIQLNTVEPRPGVELRNYIVEVSSRESVGRGSFVDEVSPVKWVKIDEVIKSGGKLRFRPGVYETVIDYYRYKLNPIKFQPGEHRHFQLIDQIPDLVYYLVLEEGFSGREAVSRWLALQKL